MNELNDSSDITLENVAADFAATPPTAAASQEKEFFEHSRARLLLEGLGQDLLERKKYAHRIYCLVMGWLVAMLGLMACEGFGSRIRFQLSDSIILAAIGATTVNVLGMLYVVANYLFPKKLTIETKPDA